MSGPERIRITHDDAYHPKVDEVLAKEGSFGMRPDQMAAMMNQGKKKVSFFYSSVFYTAVAGMLGALAGWALIEPYFGEEMIRDIIKQGPDVAGADVLKLIVMAALLDLSTVGLAACFIGAIDGLVSRNWTRGLVTGLIGLGIGVGGALVIMYPSGLLYNLMQHLAFVVSGRGEQGGEMADLTAIGYVVHMVGRAAAWAPMGLVVGLGPAVAMRSKKLAFNGIVGGVLGSFLGGLLFDPMASLLQGDEAWLSRGVGFACVGLGAGAMIGLVENLAKSAWLHVQAGALAGKQFILYKNPTVLGSSPKCEIYLFKDSAIEPKHAAIHTYGTRYEIEDLDSPAGTFVNGRKVTRQPLKNGDRIYLGETVLDFSEKESG
ncbi:MAG TPA: FHA domain-containing protein [Planctomycetota bacterium]|nr:FHA domain-containing protein [Planctomycetota bacterium]